MKGLTENARYSNGLLFLVMGAVFLIFGVMQYQNDLNARWSLILAVVGAIGMSIGMVNVIRFRKQKS